MSCHAVKLLLRNHTVQGLTIVQYMTGMGTETERRRLGQGREGVEGRVRGDGGGEGRTGKGDSESGGEEGSSGEGDGEW
jgi:hypothetical protein